MNILHLTHTDINADSRIIKEMKSLSKEEHYNIYGVGVNFEKGTVREDLKKFNIKTKSLKIFTKNLKILPRQIRHPLVFMELFIKVLFYINKKNLKVVHCHDTLVLPIGYFIKRIKKCKLFYDAHELESNKNGQTKFMSWGTLFIEKKIWKSIDLLISVSDAIIKWYEKNLGTIENVLILNSPEINVNNENNYKKNYFHKKFKIKHDKLIFLYLGFLTKGRGIEKILNVFKSQDVNSHVVFVGYGPLKKVINDYERKNKNIHFHSAVLHNEVVNLTKNADIGLCLIEKISLSDYLCLPNKFFEYIYAGIPVLASNFPELSRYVRKYKVGFCSNLSSEEIKKAISKIEKSPVEKLKLNFNELSWDTQGKKLTEKYKKILFK